VWKCGRRLRGGSHWSGLRVLTLGVLALSFVVTATPLQAQVTPTPTVQDYRGLGEEFEYRGAFTDIALAIDNHWHDVFGEARLAYVSPSVIPIERLLETACGRHGPEAAAFYCPLDQTIYLNPEFLAEQDRLVGDYAPIIVLAHEWGHHVQNLLLIPRDTGNEFELQADCLAGVYSRKAEDQNWLEPGDFLEALRMSESAGDPLSFPQDAPGAHGTYLDRRNEVMRGYLDGVTGCDLPELAPVVPDVVVDSTETTELLASLPNPLPLSHASCFGIVGDGSEDFGQLLNRFAGVPDARERLQGWGWQASDFRQFGCDGPPEGEAGWIDVSVHRFGSAQSAQEAVDYFADVRADGTRLIRAASPGIGDHSAALSGPASNGKEFTIYASQGPNLVRVTGVSPSGIPFGNVLTVARAVLAAQHDGPQQPVPAPQPGLPATAFLPAAPAVNYAECFRILTEGMYSRGDVASALQPWGLSGPDIDGLGWQDGGYRVFACANPPFGRAAQIEVIIHRFHDSDSALRAEPYFASTSGLGRNETRSCDTADALVICVFGRSNTGSPLSDVAFVLQQVAGAAR
jgi:predicted metalloprotease